MYQGSAAPCTMWSNTFFFISIIIFIIISSSSIRMNCISHIIIISSIPIANPARFVVGYASAAPSSSTLVDDEQILLRIKSILQQPPSSLFANLSDWIASTTTTTTAATDSNTSTTIAAAITSTSTSTIGPCGWSRVTCESTSGSLRVSGLDLSFLSIRRNESGMESLGFSSLAHLTLLNLSHTSLQGSISLDISRSAGLTALDLSFNDLTSLDLPQQQQQQQQQQAAASALDLLSNLELLHLGSNNISSPVARAIPAGCARLRSLNLSFNSFADDLSSQPWNACRSLSILDLSHNQLSGPLPGAFFDMLSLTHLDLSGNRLIGNLPPRLGNLAALEVLNLSENQLTGSIPAELGALTRLQWLLAGSNAIEGTIPAELSNCTSLTLLDLNDNHIHGNLPDFLGAIPALKYLVLHSNVFGGSVPGSLMRAASLKFLDLSNNSLSGPIPPSFSNLSGSLQFLLLAGNGFSGAMPPELGEMAGLQFLDLSSNRLSGAIPPTIGKLQDLLWLMLASNELSGPIPPQLGNCTSLLWLNLRSNRLSGEVPAELAAMGGDPSRVLESNQAAIDPPAALGECLMMKRWVPEDYPPYSFQYDKIRDSARCKSVWIELLTGSFVLSSCQAAESPGGYVQLTDNMLTGSIPSSLQRNRTTILLLGSNGFEGSLPPGLGKLPLGYLNVSHNRIGGEIPGGIADDTCLALLDLSYNDLSGALPASIGGLAQLAAFNVSFNPRLSGPIPPLGQFLTFSPDSYLNNSLLCFIVAPGTRSGLAGPSLPFCSSSPSGNGTADAASVPPAQSSSLHYLLIVIIGLVVLSAVLLCLGAGFYAARRYHHHRHRPDATKQAGFRAKLKRHGSSTTDEEDAADAAAPASLRHRPEARGTPPPTTILPQHRSFTYEDIVASTRGFHTDNLLGQGGFGTVYKAELPDGSVVAVKKLSHHGIQGSREFLNEMETLGDLVQENLVPFLGSCTFGSERLLIYEYLCNGSLDHWLHAREGGQEVLKWPMRLRIACHCARALVYLHHDCSPALIHRDLKSSNILLDEEFHGYLADFGLARKLRPETSHVSTVIAGTLGYVPPEYSQIWRATTKGDVYSFGVVMLELITGRQPIFTAASPGLNLTRNRGGQVSEFESYNVVDWVRFLMKEQRGHEAYHAVVKDTVGRGKEAQLAQFIELAMACTLDASDLRPTIKEVSIALESMLLDSEGT